MANLNRIYHSHQTKLETVVEKIKQYKVKNDSIYIDDACFEAQQALEFLLKGVLSYHKVPYPSHGNEGHDIGILLDVLKDNLPKYKEFSKMERLVELSSTITYWEQHGRYGEGLKVKIETVQELKNIIIELDSFVGTIE